MKVVFFIVSAFWIVMPLWAQQQIVADPPEVTFLEKMHCDIEFRMVRPDGTVKHIHGIGRPVLSPSGELVQVVGTMVDVTERKRADEARERRQLEAVDVCEITCHPELVTVLWVYPLHPLVPCG